MRVLALIPWVRLRRYARLLARIEILERDLFPEWFPPEPRRWELTTEPGAIIEVRPGQPLPQWRPLPATPTVEEVDASQTQLKQMLDAQNRLEAAHQAHLYDLYDLNAARAAFVKAVRTRQ